MKIKQKDLNGIAVLEVSGEMYGGPENMKLLELATELAEQGHKKLIINFSKVKWVASTGLGILITTKTRFERDGGKLKLSNLNERVLTLFQVTKINTVMDTHGSDEEAAASFD
ncbi:MAG TPA: STAS domain-containing protein [bacterium]|nr:STAS domain-containing protein [bacterium]